MGNIKQPVRESKNKTTSNKERRTLLKKRFALSFLDLEILQNELTIKGMHKGFPDILSSPEFLSQLVDAIKNNPRLLYDETYVIQKHPRLIYKGKSFIKVIIHKLQVKLLEAMRSSYSRPGSLDECLDAMDWILKIFDATKVGFLDLVTYHLLKGRPRKIPMSTNIKTELNAKWTTFRDKGLKILEPRYRNSHAKLNAIVKFVKEISSDFSCQVDDEDLQELSLHFHKKAPLLHVLFGYLTGIIKPPRGKREAKAKQFAYRVKRVRHILKTYELPNGHKN